jgi:PTS system nitrogen regulatory IIA component
MLAALLPRWRAFLLGRVSQGCAPETPVKFEPEHAGDDRKGLVSADDVLLDVVVASKHELLAEIAGHMESVHEMDARSVELALAHRERIASTALGEGVAIPHARVSGLRQVRSMYVRLRFPIPFDAPDGQPVTHVLVLLVPKEATQRHLEILAEAAQALGDRRLREALRHCSDTKDVVRLLGGASQGH